MNHQDPATGTVTGLIPDHPPRCFACLDEFAELIDISATGEAEQLMCKDIRACIVRQDRIEAEKDREPLLAAVPDVGIPGATA